jgi:hypothetical protein
MNVFCSLFGHTFVPETRAPSVRWNTTKDGQVLNPTVAEQAIQHLDVCRRCGLERPAGPRRHDADRPTLSASGGGEESEE